MSALTVAAPRAVVTTRRDTAPVAAAKTFEDAPATGAGERCPAAARDSRCIRQCIRASRRQQCVCKWCKQCQSYYAVQRPHSLQSATLVRCSVQSASIWCAAACDAAQRRAIVPWCSVQAHVDLSGQTRQIRPEMAASQVRAFWH